jgi:Tfp pilus assembly protein FimV
LVLLLVVLAAAGAVAVGRGALSGLAPAPPAAHATAVPAGSRSVVVRPGDTMWSIARRLQPSGDVRALVDRLISANGSASIQAGDRVVVPQ